MIIFKYKLNLRLPIGICHDLFFLSRPTGQGISQNVSISKQYALAEICWSISKGKCLVIYEFKGKCMPDLQFLLILPHFFIKKSNHV
jgi:hypothetical protein